MVWVGSTFFCGTGDDMEMSLAYMRETVECLKAHGYSATEKLVAYGEAGVEGTQFELTDSTTTLTLETVQYPDDVLRYHLAIRHGRLASRFFPLDSWKHRDDGVEFKYYAVAETGVGLSFKLFFAEAV